MAGCSSAVKMDSSPLVVIVGETGSGKSALGLDLARQFNGEIIAADSRTIYKGMDIATAKPSQTERAEIPHHVLDIVEPDEPFTVADFKRLAVEAVKDIASRGKLPIMVGGSGLYVDSVVFDYNFGPPADAKRRTALNDQELPELQKQAKTLGISEDDVNFHNKRHLIRAIENGGVIKQARALRPNTLMVGLQLNKQELVHRIHQRIEEMFQAGLIDEIEVLAAKYGWGSEAMTGVGYKAFRPYLDGKITLAEAKLLFEKGDLGLAKKQRTWFKRNKYIHWLDDPYKAVAIVTTFLNT